MGVADDVAGQRLHDVENQTMKAEVFLPEDYRPAEDEPFMNERQLEYFPRKLINWKNDILAESRDTIEGLQDSARNVPDVADRASEETDRALEAFRAALEATTFAEVAAIDLALSDRLDAAAPRSSSS